MTLAVILGAGKGERLGRGSKAFVKLYSRSMIEWATIALSRIKIRGFVWVVPPELVEEAGIIASALSKEISKEIAVSEGGESRGLSSLKGFNMISRFNPDEEEVVMFHNAANIFVDKKNLAELEKAALSGGAAILAARINDALKESDEGDFVKRWEGNSLFRAQTPQAFSFDNAKKMFSSFKEQALKNFRDEAEMADASGIRVRIVETPYSNFKITTIEDMRMAIALMEDFFPESVGSCIEGIGEDSHELDEAEKEGESGLVIGGVKVSNSLKSRAWSDGDAVLHALFNALSSAAGGKSIGYYFPNNEENKGRQSSEFVPFALKMLKEKGLGIKHVSASIIAPRPRLEPFREEIIKSMSRILGIDEGRIGLTFTSGEGCGIKGIKATVIVSAYNLH